MKTVSTSRLLIRCRNCLHQLQNVIFMKGNFSLFQNCTNLKVRSLISLEKTQITYHFASTSSCTIPFENYCCLRKLRGLIAIMHEKRGRRRKRKRVKSVGTRAPFVRTNNDFPKCRNVGSYFSTTLRNASFHNS